MGWMSGLTAWIKAQFDELASSIGNALQDLIDWFTETYTELTDFFRELGHDVLYSTLEALFAVIVQIANSIPVPDFLTSYNLNTILGEGGPWVAFVFGNLGFGSCLAVIAAGWAFRLLRKVFTLGQW